MTTVTAGAALSHVGRVRTANQDSGYAGTQLFVVADGMGGHAGGDVASSIAVQRIAQADELDFATPQEAEFALQSSLIAANQLISEAVFEHPELTGMGTTVSAMIRVGDAIATAHIGDSRIYLFRDGELSQITNDHTFVQRLVETGRITPEEAAVHPRRSVLMRVLGDIEQAPEVDTSILGTVAGDRWLLCSDGLSSYVSEERILAVLASADSAAEACDRLVTEALDHGAPDNVTAVVVDIDRAGEGPGGTAVVGAAASPVEIEGGDDSGRLARLPGLLLHPLRAATPEASFVPESDDYLDALIKEDHRRIWRRRIIWLAAVTVLLAALGVALLGAYRYTQTRYFVGFAGDRVAIYQGVQGSVGPLQLSHVVQETDLTKSQLSGYARSQVEGTINAASLADAQQIVENARESTGG